MKRILFLLLISLLAEENFPQVIKEIIPPISLTKGETDTLIISDLFYSDNYNLEFPADKNFSINYLKNEKLLIISSSENYKGLSLINFILDGKNFVIPVKVAEVQNYNFTFKPSKKADRVNLIGTFNGWDRNNLVMNDENSDGTYEITIPLEVGLYEYKFFVDGEELTDPLNAELKPNGIGGFNSLLKIEDEESGKNYLHILEKSITHNGYKISFYYEGDNQKDLTKDNIIAIAGNQKIEPGEIDISGNRIDLFIGNKNYDLMPEENIIRVAVNYEGEVSNIQSVFLNDKDMPNDMIIYALMIDRFYDGNRNNSKEVGHPELKAKANYMGGDFEGIINKLDDGYFNSLGINTIWLSPVNENTNSAYREYPEPHRYYTGYHGYWPVSSQNVEERFGDINLLKKLVEIAHKKNIKILLDYVSHHVHIEHPFWVEHRDWFGDLELPDGRKNLRLWDEHRLTTWFEPYLPSFDFTKSNEALEAMTDNAVWWLKATGVDGFRHDAVKHVPNIFWRTLTKKIKEEIEIPHGQKIYQIGETFGSYDLISSYVNNGQLNAQFNFNLYDMALPVFLTDTIPFSLLDTEMKKTFAIYGVNHLMGNIMDSHDKVRFMAYADGDISLSDPNTSEIGWENPPEVDKPSSYEKLKLHLTYLLTIPGIPVIYYGDEIGMTGAGDPDNRRMMRFGQDLNSFEKSTLNEISKLTALRNEHTALRYGDFYSLLSNKDVYIFLRSDGKERILTALCKSSSDIKTDIILPEFYNVSNAEDLLTGEKIEVKNNKLNLNLPSTGYVIYKLK